MSNKFNMGNDFGDDKPIKKPKKHNPNISFNEVKQLIETFNNNASISELSWRDFSVKRFNNGTTVTQVVTKETAKIEPKPEISKYQAIKSPMVGTCYLAPSPDSDNFIEIGQQVQAGDTICLIEAMKMFNKIKAEVSGTVKKIHIEDSQPVEFAQILFEIDPS